MKTLLRIDASARTNGSHSRRVADYYLEVWLENNTDGQVISRDLTQESIPHLDQKTIEAFQYDDLGSPESRLSERLIGELMAADDILIASPVYNLTLPSALKAWLDYVVRSGKTFEETEEGVSGLLTGKKATVITVSGHPLGEGLQADHQSHYLKDILTFIGVDDTDIIQVEGTAMEESIRDDYFEKAKTHIESLFTIPGFSCLGNDSEVINQLRLGQVKAIENGDAEAYASLCTDDIQLLIPGSDVVQGKKTFLDTEKTLFATNKILSFRKTPLRFERTDGIVIETGRQHVEMACPEPQGGVFSKEQKYTHIFRLTDQGWKFSLLMSNPS